MALTLPPSPESQVAIRVHRMRVARGACWVIAFALLGASALTMIDAAALLPSWVRGLGLAVWLTGFGVLIWFFIVRRLNRKRSHNAARAAAKELPENIRAAAAAAILILGCLLTAVFVPSADEHIRRVAIPWHRPALAQYRIVVTSKEPIVHSGDAITLSAYVEKLDASVPIPDSGTLFCRDLSGNETTIRMSADETGAFHATCASVNSDFEYRVEVAGVSSDWFNVTVLQSADPTQQSTLEIKPPKYASGIVPQQTVAGFTSFSGIQYGMVELNLKFSCRATKAYLEWQPEPGGAVEVPFIAVALSSDSLSGTAAFQLKQDGVLRLVTFTEMNGKTLSSKSAVSVRVATDSPPRFERVRGVSSRPLTVRPGQTLPIEFTAIDDIAIGAAAIEYAIGNDVSRPATLPISLSGAGTTRAEGRIDFDLPGKLREGETVRYRIRIADIRRISDLELKPQEIVYPNAGWSIVGVNPSAPPIDQQEIEGQRDEIGKGLDMALTEINELIAEVQSLRSDTSSRFDLHHQVLLEKIRGRQKVVGMNLLELARNAALTIELRSLASAIGAISDRHLSDADEQFGKALTEKRNSGELALTAAIKHLSMASDWLDRLKIRNRQLAQVRLDCKKFETLVADQSALASLLKPEIKTSPVELARLQKELSARLAIVIAESDPLKEAMADERRNALVGFTSQISDLAKMLVEIDTAIKQLEAEVRKGMLDAFAAEVSKESAKATALVAKLELAARLAKVNTPKPEEFDRIVNLIVEGKTLEALTELQRMHGALESVAISLEKWVSDSTNPKFACRQFANWQDDLRSRFNTATGSNDANYKTLPQATKISFQNEQKAIRAALASLVIPAARDLAIARDGAIMHILKVETCLGGTGVGADTAIKEAYNALNQLADKIPGIPERIARARAALEDLQKEQEQILSSFRDLIGKDFKAPGTPQIWAKKFGQLALRQHQQYAIFSTLDFPGIEARRIRILAALGAAVADLEAGLPLEAFASQTWTNREFERLKLVLGRLPPPEERVDELTQRLEANNGFQEIHKHLSQLSAPEAVALRNDAEVAIQAVENAFRDASKVKERPQLLKLAVAAMQRLSDRLVGAESELERIQRLAWNRYLAFLKAESLKGMDIKRADSDEARRQLGREIDELLCTRVGLAGQAIKQRALDQYEKMKAIGEPDHAAGLQKALADTLDELAGMMADVNELTVVFSRVLTRPAATEADNYLPSTQYVDALRNMAKQQQLLRDRLNHLPAELLKKIEENESKIKIAGKRVQIEGLILKTNELAEKLQQAIMERGIEDSLTSQLEEARQTVLRSAKLLIESKDKINKGQRADAEKCRAEAQSALRNQADRIGKLIPQPISPNNLKTLSCAEALIQASSAMKQASELIVKKSDMASARKAMHKAMETLQTASAIRMRALE